MDGGWAVLVTPTIAAPEEASAFVAARLAEGSDFIKIIYDNAHASFGLNLPTLKEDTIAALVSAAHAQHRLAVAHIRNGATSRGRDRRRYRRFSSLVRHDCYCYRS